MSFRLLYGLRLGIRARLRLQQSTLSRQSSGFQLELPIQSPGKSFAFRRHFLFGKSPRCRFRRHLLFGKSPRCRFRSHLLFGQSPRCRFRSPLLLGQTPGCSLSFGPGFRLGACLCFHCRVTCERLGPGLRLRPGLGFRTGSGFCHFLCLRLLHQVGFFSFAFLGGEIGPRFCPGQGRGVNFVLGRQCLVLVLGPSELFHHFDFRFHPSFGLCLGSCLGCFPRLCLSHGFRLCPGSGLLLSFQPGLSLVAGLLLHLRLRDYLAQFGLCVFAGRR